MAKDEITIRAEEFCDTPVSFAARGFWARLLFLMYRCQRRGFITPSNKPLTAEQVAILAGCSTGDAAGWLAELLESGVAATDGNGILYSPAMVKDERIRKLRTEAGRKGGNPVLVKQNDDNDVLLNQKTGGAPILLNQGVNQTVKQNNSSSCIRKKSREGGVGETNPWADLPAELNTPAFREAWEKYIAHRRAIRSKALQAHSVVTQWRRLAPFGEATAVAAIAETIGNGWVGIFPEKVKLPPPVLRITPDSSAVDEVKRWEEAKHGKRDTA